jgi:hypothetical protein
VRGGLLFGFYVGHRDAGRINTSQLLFANDTLILCGADPDHLCPLWCLFLCFEAVSGLKINFAKLELVPVGNVMSIM